MSYIIWIKIENKNEIADWEKIFAKRISNKEFASRTYKELSKQSNRINNPFQKWAEKYFKRRDTDDKKHMKICSAVLVISKIQLKYN